MSIDVIDNELIKMSNAERLSVVEKAIRLIRKNIVVESPEKKLSLEEAAELLYEDYLNDEELTAVTGALDGEDFYDA